jgi:hypothetical protein
MKQFFIKVFVFVVLFLLLSSLLQRLAPYYWENAGYAAKIRYLNATPEQYNTYFFGSSRMYRHIAPIEFDQIVMYPVKSFNLGYGTIFVPESYYLVENFIKRIGPAEQGFIFIELQVINQLPARNLHTTKVKYFLTTREYLFAIKATLQNSILTGSEKQEILINYTITYLERLTGIGLLYDLFKTVTNELINPTTPGGYAVGNCGYLSLEEELLITDANTLRTRNEKFLEDTSVLELRKKQSMNLYHKNQPSNYNHIHLQRIEKLVKVAEEKGYDLIFVLPPRLGPDQYRELLPLFREIDDQHKIDLGDPERFPEFYLVENSFDIGHLNQSGAQILTRKLAEAFNELLKNESIDSSK